MAKGFNPRVTIIPYAQRLAQMTAPSTIHQAANVTQATAGRLAQISNQARFWLRQKVGL